MRFKLPKKFPRTRSSIFSLLFFFDITFAAVVPDPDVTGYRSTVPSLDFLSISSVALRPDGRYLFYSTGAANFYVLDNLNRVQVSEVVTVPGTVKGLFVDSSSVLVVAHADGVSGFDISKPLKISEYSTSRFDREDNLATTVNQACRVSGASATFLLETGSSHNKHLIRKVTGTTSTSILWSAIFTDANLEPLRIFCTNEGVVLFAQHATNKKLYGTFSSAANLSFGSVKVIAPSNMPNYLDQDYTVKDFVLSFDKSTFFFLLNRGTNQNNDADSVVFSVAVSSLDGGATANMGQDATLLSIFTLNDKPMFGVSIGKEFSTLYPSNFKHIEQTSFPGSFDNYLRGNPIDSSASFENPSQWFSVTSDPYAYGIISDEGLVMISKAPRLEIPGTPANTTLTSSADLSFKILSDRDVSYDIRFENSPNEEGSSVGLPANNGSFQNYGKKVASGSLAADVAKDITLSISDLQITREGTNYLSIFAWETHTLIARAGLEFTFNPPPMPVTNLHTKTGDQSIHVFFKGPAINDLKEYKIWFSHNEADLQGPGPWASGSIQTVTGEVLNSPMSVSKADWSGSIVLAPVANEVEVFVRVKVYDQTGQESVDDPAAVSAIPHATKSLEDILGGSANSCLLETESTPSISVVILVLLGFLSLLWLRFRRQSS